MSLLLLALLVGVVSATAHVRAVHGIPGLPVDIYVDGAPTWLGVTYQQSAQTAVAAGSHIVEIRAAGAPADSAPILSLTAVLFDGEDVDVVAHLTDAAAATPKLSAFYNDQSCVDNGFGRVTIRHAAKAPAVDVTAGTPTAAVLADNLANGAEAKLERVAAGSIVDVRIRLASDNSVVPFGPATVVLERATHKVIYAVGSTAVSVIVLDAPLCATPATVSLRVIHGVPAAVVDVYADGNKILSDFAYRSVSPTLLVPPGNYLITVNLAGTPDVVLTAPLTFSANDNKDIAAHLTAAGTITATVFSNNLLCLPNRNGRVAVRHVAAAGAVNVLSAGSATPIISGLTNPNNADVSPLPVDTYNVRVEVAASGAVAIGPAALRLTNRKLVVVYAVGSTTVGFSFVTHEISGVCKTPETNKPNKPTRK